MRILLIDSDPNRPQRYERWRQRLQPFDDSLTTASSPSEAGAIVASSHFGLVIQVSGSDRSANNEALGHAVDELRSRAGYVIDAVENAIERGHAFTLGYDDCVMDDCDDVELAKRIKNASDLEKLNQRLAQAQKLESIGELAAGIAHEINTPIQYVGDNTRFVQEACGDLEAVLKTCQSLLVAVDTGINVDEATDKLRSAMGDADIDYLIEEIPSAISQTLEGVDRVANIVRAMKEFAHPGVSEMTLTDLAHAIGNTVMVARNEWKYVAELVTDFDPNMPLVPCLPGELNQVLLNMIVNAAHAIGDTLGETPDAKGTITISTKSQPHHAEIRITDTGSGIPEDHLERIFTPFFTTKGAGKGTGQGLAIAQSVIVEKHGGSIDVESERGQGTTFVIRIPLQNEPARSNEPATHNQPAKQASAGTSGVPPVALSRAAGTIPIPISQPH
ncbi:Sensor protein ZraS [Rubripirellula amarantea]|uniref:histidine kinase n=1 Tax=Rubripirellula amarantea TaxID=2527999 RepID=A0A5C5WLB9_9BACT|nr:ATP-binding protein [Rubripirellula amarantea]TWT50562.1 Sensor protein ZraS [Rubripirellula amarantea]